MSHLILVAHAVAPGPGGAEGLVNARLLRALAEHWTCGVSVITGGGIPCLEDGAPFSDLPGWKFHTLGVDGGSGPNPSLLNRVARRSLEQISSGAGGSIPARALNRLTYCATGSGLKMASWRAAASRALREELEKHPDSIVYSRALPFASIQAAAAVRRERAFRWIVNINDPLPPDVWPLSVETWSCRRVRSELRKTIPLVSAFTFPCSQLSGMEREAFPEMDAVPALVLPHITRPPGSAVNNDCPSDGVLHFAYAGSMNGGRVRPELVAALQMFAKSEPDRTCHLHFSFHLNHADRSALRLIEALPVSKEVSIGGFGEESDEALLRADVSLDIAGNEDRPLLNTKTATYVGYGKPIWAICKPEGTTWNLVKRGWGYASVAGDVGSIVGTLEEIYTDWSAGSLALKRPAPEIVERFSAKRQVDDLRALCERISATPDRVREQDTAALKVDWP